MASSSDSQSVDIHITDASQTKHLPAIIAAAGSRKVNVYFNTSSALGQLPATEAFYDLPNAEALELENLDVDSDITDASEVGFNDLPLEILINIFKLVFICDTPQSFRVGSEQYGQPAKSRGRVVHFPDISMQLLRVSKIWEQYGKNLILENTFSIITSCTTQWAANLKLDEHARSFFMSRKHLAIPAHFFNQSQLRKLIRFKNLQSVHLILTNRSVPYLETVIPGLHGNSEDPILASKAKLKTHLPAAWNYAFQFFLKDSLKTVSYMYTNKYQRTRELPDGTKEVKFLAVLTRMHIC